MGKYDPLEGFLNQTAPRINDIILTFAQIEQIIGDSLPPDAYNPKGTWWRNTHDEKRPQSKAWLSAGWHVASRSQVEKWVRFRRQR